MRARLVGAGVAIAVAAVLVALLAYLFRHDGDRVAPGDRAVLDDRARETPNVVPNATSSNGSESAPATAKIQPRSATGRAAIAGRVVDENGQPIAGASILVEERGSRAVAGRAASNAAGGFEIVDLESGRYDCFAEAPGYAWRVIPVRVEPDRVARVDCVLVAGPEILGQVVDESGAPVEGADVTVAQAFVDAVSGRQQEPRFARKTGPGGWFSVPGTSELPSGLVSIRARKEGVGTGSSELPGRADRDFRTITLKPARTLTLRFAPEDGSAPPAGLKFWIALKSWVTSSATDAAGLAAIADVPRGNGFLITVVAGEWSLSPGDRRGVRMRRHFDVAPEGDAAIVVPLLRSSAGDATADGIVEGRVVDSFGAPVAGVDVNAKFPTAPELAVTTGPSGAFRLEGVPPHPKQSVGTKRGNGLVVYASTFELAAGATVTGVTIVFDDPTVVVDVIGTDGRRVPGVGIILDGEVDGEPVRLRGRTDGSGRATFERVPCETIVVSVDPETVPPGVRGDENLKRIFWSRDPKPIEVRLREERVFRGTVVGEDGSPLAGWSLTFRAVAVPGAGSGGMTATFKPGPGPEYSGNFAAKFARTNARGEFALRVTSMEDFTLVDATRVVQLEDGRQELQRLVPLRPSTLRSDGENRLVMRKD